MKISRQIVKDWFQQYRWALLSGVLIGTTYIPFPPWALLFCYTPLWLSLLRQPDNSLKKAWWSGWWTQFVLSLIGFHWIAHTAHEFAYMPWPISALVLLAFAAAIHLHIPLATVGTVWLRQKLKLSDTATLVVFALTLSLAERLWPAIFPWHLGYPLLWAQLPVAHLADFVGFAGLSTLVLLANAWMGFIWGEQNFPKKAVVHAALLLACAGGLNALGYWRWASLPTEDQHLQVGIVQANIGNLEKVFAEKGRGYQSDIIQKFLGLSQNLVLNKPETEVLIWPETAFPDFLNPHEMQRRYPSELAQGLGQLQRPIMTGAYSRTIEPQPQGGNRERTYNAFFMVDSNGQNIDRPYHKTHLLVFGEYLPLSEQFPFLLKLLPFVANFDRGDGAHLQNFHQSTRSVRIGAQICYEGLYPAFSRSLAEQSAQVMINVTNDSWFGQTFEPHQHLYMTLARAIETRTPLVRSTNTGISTVISARGQIMDKSPLHQEWAQSYKVPFYSQPQTTFFVRWGHLDIFLWLFVLLTVIGKAWYENRIQRP